MGFLGGILISISLVGGFAALIGLLVGLIRPKSAYVGTRKKAFIRYGTGIVGAFVLALVAGGVLSRTSTSPSGSSNVAVSNTQETHSERTNSSTLNTTTKSNTETKQEKNQSNQASNSTSTTNGPATKETQKHTETHTTPVPPLQTVAENAVHDAVGVSSTMKNGNAFLGFMGGSTQIVMVEANDNLSDHLIQDGIYQDTTILLKDMFKDSRVNDLLVDWYFPLTDAYGNQQNVIVEKLEFTRSTVNQINWNNFLWTNIPNIADGVTVNPDFNNGSP